MFKYRIEKKGQVLWIGHRHVFQRRCIHYNYFKKKSSPKSTIRRWISNFVEENCIEMKSKKYSKKINCKTNSIDDEGRIGCDEKALRDEIKRLERELKREKLRADLNEEIISVAEQKFNFQIRKKAGAKR